MKHRSTRSSWTGGPGLRAVPRRLLWLLKIRATVHSRLTRLRLATIPWAGSSSAMNRYPNSGSS